MRTAWRWEEGRGKREETHPSCQLLAVLAFVYILPHLREESLYFCTFYIDSTIHLLLATSLPCSYHISLSLSFTYSPVSVSLYYIYSYTCNNYIIRYPLIITIVLMPGQRFWIYILKLFLSIFIFFLFYIYKIVIFCIS